MSSEQVPGIEDLITVKDVAERHDMGESTAWLLIRRHDLDRYRVPGQGKKTFIRRDAFERALRTPIPIQGEPKKAAA